MNVGRSIQLARGGQGVVAQSPIAAHLSGFDPGFRSENGEYDSARAKALLDTYGYLDRDGDGWRDLPNGQSLVLSTWRASRHRSHANKTVLFQKGHEGDRPQSAIQDCAVAGKLQGGTGRQADDVAERRFSSRSRWHRIPPKNVRTRRRQLQSFAVQVAGDGFAVRENSANASMGMNETRCLIEPSESPSPTCPRRPPCTAVVSYMNHPWVIGFRIKPFIPGWYQMVDIDTSLAPPR